MRWLKMAKRSTWSGLLKSRRWVKRQRSKTSIDGAETIGVAQDRCPYLGNVERELFLDRHARVVLLLVAALGEELLGRIRVRHGDTRAALGIRIGDGLGEGRVGHLERLDPLKARDAVDDEAHERAVNVDGAVVAAELLLGLGGGEDGAHRGTARQRGQQLLRVGQRTHDALNVESAVRRQVEREGDNKSCPRLLARTCDSGQLDQVALDSRMSSPFQKRPW
jgi:hypothetical protein